MKPVLVSLALIAALCVSVFVLNNGYSTRTSASGKQRTTIEVKAEPIVVNLDAQSLAKPVALAIAEVLRERIGAISQTASAATLRARESAARAYAGIQERRKQAGEAKAAKKAQQPQQPRAPKFGPKMPPKFGPQKPQTASGGVSKRYTGGRLGAMAPNQSDRLFHDSGRLIKSIAVAMAKAGTDAAEFVINVASNRFDPTTLNPGDAGSSAAALDRVITMLRQHVPMLGDPKLMMDDLRVRRSVQDVVGSIHSKQSARISELKADRARAIIGLVRSVVGG